MAKKCFLVGIISVMLLFVVFEASALTIDATFVDTEYPEDTIVLRKDGTFSATIDGVTTTGTYEMQSYITKGQSTLVNFYGTGGTQGQVHLIWGTEMDRPAMPINGGLFELRGGSLQ